MVGSRASLEVLLNPVEGVYTPGRCSAASPAAGDRWRQCHLTGGGVGSGVRTWFLRGPGKAPWTLQARFPREPVLGPPSRTWGLGVGGVARTFQKQGAGLTGWNSVFMWLVSWVRFVDDVFLGRKIIWWKVRLHAVITHHMQAGDCISAGSADQGSDAESWCTRLYPQQQRYGVSLHLVRQPWVWGSASEGSSWQTRSRT